MNSYTGTEEEVDVDDKHSWSKGYIVSRISPRSNIQAAMYKCLSSNIEIEMV